MPKRLSVFAFPVLLVGTLQVTGCLQREIPPPDPGGAYRSTSAGAEFTQSVDLVDESGTLIGYIDALFLGKIHRPAHQTDRIYATASGNGVVLSENDGQTWQHIPQPLNNAKAVVELASEIILISGTNEDNEGVVVRSLDRGQSWEQVLTIPAPKREDSSFFEIIKPPPPPPIIVASIVADPHRPDEVYATTSTGEVLIGTNSGKTWQTMTRVIAKKTDPLTGRSDSPVREVIPSPTTIDEVLIITQEGGLLKATRGGDQEVYDVQVGKVLDAQYISQVPGAILVGTTTGTFIPKDTAVIDRSSALAIPVSQSAPLTTMIVRASPTNPSRLLVGVNNVIYRSEDGGVSWNALSLDLPNHLITDISINPTNASRVLLITTPFEA